MVWLLWICGARHLGPSGILLQAVHINGWLTLGDYAVHFSADMLHLSAQPVFTESEPVFGKGVYSVWAQHGSAIFSTLNLLPMFFPGSVHFHRYQQMLMRTENRGHFASHFSCYCSNAGNECTDAAAALEPFVSDQHLEDSWRLRRQDTCA